MSTLYTQTDHSPGCEDVDGFAHGQGMTETLITHHTSMHIISHFHMIARIVPSLKTHLGKTKIIAGIAVGTDL